ncbi:hypothetical protein K491DRAFT_612584 [Lophiostoma macrostomum CBS 122681]|uniref:Rab proteins geranylgeranyltransferase n=1 Tax=Lophiostoma macrostomum CBS 122681 TaxID=1314788 RepID=A0A6A6SPI9_9PLEO|nr:hypothetical protein K491DRAFT_612584 [Lophiostoma macrostomum CBS 122681]
METLDKTEWDVLLVGTGLQQSLLALALSRSGKKILHVDENDYYGGSEAAFSLTEAEEWAQKANGDASAAAFTHASISKPDHTGSTPAAPSLSHARKYNLDLSPQLIYARSTLLQYLVSSKVFRQLEFLAVGSWWVYTPASQGSLSSDAASSDEETAPRGRLLKVPSGREDVFQDQVLDFKTKRALMKFLRFISEYEEQGDVWKEHRSRSFPSFLSEQFKVPVGLQAPLLALTLSPTVSEEVTVEFALPRIARHLRSIGVFGAGFGAVIPKWGGMSEITQVACRASAVGGSVYVLGKGVSSVQSPETEGAERTTVLLKGGKSVTTKWLVEEGSDNTPTPSRLSRSITIISSPLTPLFPPLAEDAPSPASAVVVFPSGSLSGGDTRPDNQSPPVHVFIHSSDTEECPKGHSVLYASIALDSDAGFQLLEQAVTALLSAVDVTPQPTILWSARYIQQGLTGAVVDPTAHGGHRVQFPPPSLDLAFDDAVLDHVQEAWRKIMGDDAGEFLVFEDREAYADEDE